MNKKFLFLSLLTLLFGLLLGYAGDYFTRFIPEKSSPSGEKERSLVRRFGDSSQGGQASSATARKSHKSQPKELDQNMLRLAKLNLDEIQAEIEQICQKSGYPTQLSYFDRISLALLYSRLGQKAPLQTLAKIENLPSNKRSYIGYILSAWATRNPEAAMNYCLSEKNPSDPMGYAQIITKTSPDTALEWVGGLYGIERTMAKMGFLIELSKSHPERMGEFATRLGDIKSYSNIHGATAAQWIKIDKEAALKWINTLSGELKREAMGEALSVLPLEESMRELSTLTGKTKDAAIAKIASTLAHKSEEQAIEWIMKNADADPESLERITQSLYDFDYLKPSVQEYLTKMPAGEMKDLLIENAVYNLVYSEYHSDVLQDVSSEELLSLASNVGNTERKEQVIEEVLGNWIYKDPEATRAWLDKSDMPQEKKKKFYEKCDRFLKAEKE